MKMRKKERIVNILGVERIMLNIFCYTINKELDWLKYWKKN